MYQQRKRLVIVVYAYIVNKLRQELMSLYFKSYFCLGKLVSPRRSKPLTASISPSFILWKVNRDRPKRTGSLFSHPALSSPTCRVEALTQAKQANKTRPPLPQLKITHRSKVHCGWSKCRFTPVLIHNEEIYL